MLKRNSWYKRLRENAIVIREVKDHIHHIKITDKETGEVRYERWKVKYHTGILETVISFNTEKEAIEYNERCKEFVQKQRLSNGIKIEDAKEYPINLLKSLDIDSNNCETDYIKVLKNFNDNFDKVAEELLTPRERRIIQARFEEFKTLEKVAEEFGVTRERVRQIEQKTLRKLKLRRNVFLNKERTYDLIRSDIYEQLKAEAIAEVERLKEKLTVEAAYEIIKEYERTHGRYHQDTEIDNVRIQDLGLSVRSTNALLRNEYRTFKDIKSLTEYDLRKIRNLGVKSIREILDYTKSYLS